MSGPEKIVILKNEVEARLLSSILDEEEIPHVLRSYHDTAYDGIWQAQMGWGHVEAPPEYADRIREIHRNLSEE